MKVVRTASVSGSKMQMQRIAIFASHFSVLIIKVPMMNFAIVVEEASQTGKSILTVQAVT